MAFFNMRMQIVQRSAGRSAVAAAAYRAGERLHDQRQDIVHDYSHRGGVEHKEILLPDDAPIWVRGIDRETLWNAVEAKERRKDSQLCREFWVTIPRELDPQQRIQVVRDYVLKAFVSHGMVADVCWHSPKASDGLDNPHAHCMLTMRPLVADGFGQKVRHDWVPDPTGARHPDGRPVMVVSNAQSWNCPDYFERCREDWENTANAALEKAGSTERIDRRSFLERGIARLPQPALRLAYYLKDLHGSFKDRFGQWQYARHYAAVEQRAKGALGRDDQSPSEVKRTSDRFFGWFERQLDRLDPARANARAPDSKPLIDVER